VLYAFSFAYIILICCYAIFVPKIDLRNWHEEDKRDRDFDHAEFENELSTLRQDDQQIMQALDLNHAQNQNRMYQIITLLERLVSGSTATGTIGNEFIKHTLKMLRHQSGLNKSSLPDWLVSEWDVDLGDRIGGGGFADVYRGTYLNHRIVAIKRLKLEALDTERLRRKFIDEVSTWNRIRDKHVRTIVLYGTNDLIMSADNLFTYIFLVKVLPLIGACPYSQPPFMVSPFCVNGHVLKYLEKHNFDPVEKLRLSYEVKLHTDVY
jgi:hypothetical protein